jgi:hypothetical protein
VLINATLLCIEVDEHQPRDRSEYDETIRYDDLYMIHSGKFIFIRFNPHAYRTADNQKKNPRLETRFARLAEEIRTQIGRITDDLNTEPLEVRKLFFNEQDW